MPLRATTPISERRAAEPVPRKSAYGRLLDHFHTHPQGRLHEILFWNGAGLLLGGITFAAYATGRLSLPLALILAIVAICLFLWGFLPQKRPKAAPPPVGRLRAEKKAAVKASKEEGRRARAAKRGER